MQGPVGGWQQVQASSEKPRSGTDASLRLSLETPSTVVASTMMMFTGASSVMVTGASTRLGVAKTQGPVTVRAEVSLWETPVSPTPSLVSALPSRL
eukprot:1420701-Rhodomonas_salina.1